MPWSLSMSGDIKIPPLGVDTAVTLINWLVSVGDEVVAGDVIAELESDKTVVELAVERSGTISNIDIEAGTENLLAGEVVARFAGASSSITDTSPDSFAGATDDASSPPSPAVAVPAVSPASDAVVVPQELTPLARRIIERGGDQYKNRSESSTSQAKAGARITARDLGVLKPPSESHHAAWATASQPASVTPLAGRMLELTGQAPDTYRASGTDGRLLASDVGIKFARGTRASGADAADDDEACLSQVNAISAPWVAVEADGVRRQIARRLQQSKRQAPHYYMSRSIVVDNLLQFRKVVNEELDESERISLNDIIVHIVAKVLSQDHALNACWVDNSIRQFTRVDLAVAVAGKRGLMTPVLRDAASFSLRQTASALRPLVDKAMNGNLQAAEYQGGTFTISNLGMYGVDSFAAILNPPQAAILAIGAAGPELELVDGEVVSTQKMTATLSVDHRVADGIDGARFLDQFAALSEDLRRLLL